MEFIRKNYSGILVCLAIAVVSWLLGKAFPIVGGAIIAIVIGMIITLIWKDKGKAGCVRRDRLPSRRRPWSWSRSFQQRPRS